MLSIGNEELDKKDPVPEDEIATCPNCGKEHKIIWGTSEGVISKTLGAVKCPENGNLYLAAINNKIL